MQRVAFDRYVRVHLALTDYAKPQREHYELPEQCRRGEAEDADLAVRRAEGASDLPYEHLEGKARDGHPEVAEDRA